MPERYHLLIPHYCHVHQRAVFLPQLATAGLPALIVDDGSDSSTRRRLRGLIAGHPWASLLERNRNRGKGAAMITGMKHLHAQGATHVISLDADGQHDPAEIARLRLASQRHPARVISGKPVFGDDMPKVRLHGRKLTNVLARLAAGGGQVEDAMCGLRLYPLASVLPLFATLGTRVRMEFDVEILVRACWAGLELEFMPTRVVYPQGGRSHFRLFADNARFCRMHTVLILQALRRLLNSGHRTRQHRGA